MPRNRAILRTGRHPLEENRRAESVMDFEMIAAHLPFTDARRSWPLVSTAASSAAPTCRNAFIIFQQPPAESTFFLLSPPREAISCHMKQFASGRSGLYLRCFPAAKLINDQRKICVKRAFRKNATRNATSVMFFADNSDFAYCSLAFLELSAARLPVTEMKSAIFLW